MSTVSSWQSLRTTVHRQWHPSKVISIHHISDHLASTSMMQIAILWTINGRLAAPAIILFCVICCFTSLMTQLTALKEEYVNSSLTMLGILCIVVSYILKSLAMSHPLAQMILFFLLLVLQTYRYIQLAELAFIVTEIFIPNKYFK